MRPKLIEALLFSSDQKVQGIAAGDCHSMARTHEGRVYSWGSGSYGRLGLGSEADQSVPKLVSNEEIIIMIMIWN